MTHRHSRLALAMSSDQLSKRCADIMKAVYAKPGWNWTDRELKAQLFLHDMNSVRPRITELIQSGWLRECGETRCPVTGKTVRLVEAVGERQLELKVA